MLKVKVKPGENLDKVLKDFKMKVRKTKLLQKIRENQFFDKPSNKKRKKKQHAIYVQKLREMYDA